MRLPAAALASCACVVLALGGCGVQPVNRVAVSTGSSQNASSNTADTSNPSNPSNTSSAKSNGSANAGGSNREPVNTSSVNQADNQTSQPGTGPNAADTAQSGTNQSDASGQTATAAHPGSNNTTPSTGDAHLLPISSGTASNLVQARFAANAWHGMGEAALLVTPPNSYGLNGSLLYIVADGRHSSTGKPEATLLDQHAISASISPDGKWVMVEAQVNEGTVSLPNFQTHLLFESIDGTKRIDLGHVPYVEGDWTGPETYMYTDGSGHVYSTQPGKKPSALPLALPAGVTISALRVNPRSGWVAIDEVIPDPNGNIIDRHDVIALWDPKTNKVQNLLTASQSNGYILGPWTNDGSLLFYWPDPMHSGSVAADGLQLSTIDTDGRTRTVATTLTGDSSVIPVSSHEAVLQAGASRYLFVKKTIEVWTGQKLIPLPGQAAAPSSTEVWPTVSPNGQVVAYSVGNTLPVNATTSQTSAWWQQLQLVTVNLSTGQKKVLKGAGSGIVNPMFNSDGSRIAFLNGNTFDVVSADGSGMEQPVFSVTPTSTGSYPQWDASLPIQVADYHP